MVVFAPKMEGMAGEELRLLQVARDILSTCPKQKILHAEFRDSDEVVEAINEYLQREAQTPDSRY